jgi:ribonuclease P protein component
MSAPSTASGVRRLRRSMRRADFLRASELGRRLNARYFLILALDRRAAEGAVEERTASGEPTSGEPTTSGEPRLGITVTRRVGKAVRRNRIKRLVREWFRGSHERLQRGWRGYDLVVIAKREIPESLRLAEVKSDLDRALGERPSGRDASRPPA